MAVEGGIFAAIILLVILIIIVAGFACYMLRNYCTNKAKITRRTSSGSPRREGLSNILIAEGVAVGGSMSNYKTTTDDNEPSMKLHTFDQILKQEERSYTTVAQPTSIYPKFHHSTSTSKKDNTNNTSNNNTTNSSTQPPPVDKQQVQQQQQPQTATNV